MEKGGLGGVHDEVSLDRITCDDDTYYSIVFRESNYAGGGSAFNIEKDTGRAADVLEAAGMDREELEAAITEQFILTQGNPGITSAVTMGEYWMEKYEEGSRAAGYFLTDGYINLYFGNQQIAEGQEGFPTVAIPRADKCKWLG